MMTSNSIRPLQKGTMQRGLAFVVVASSLGTLIEWYDFYIYAILTVVLAGKFFPGDLANSFLASLAALWVGFAVRPFGAGLFGYLGDAIGRKYTFLTTLLLMGFSTVGVGLLPSFETIGYAAPCLLVLMRCVQGLALGGEFGGAAAYVAETAPDNRRGFYTSFIQVTATIGLVAALAVVVGTQAVMSKQAFLAWGWRLPFIFSSFLVGISLWVRKQLAESPVYAMLKEAGKTAKSPLREIGKVNWYLMVIVLFGAVAGQAVVSYCSQMYQMYFMIRTLHVQTNVAYIMAAAGIILATPFYLFWAALSDRYGRKWIILSGCMLATFAYWPIYHLMAWAASYGQSTIRIHYVAMVVLLFAQMFLVTMVSGPIMAMLAETFPTNVRYTCMSLPYHVGNGEFGGLTPLIATFVAAWWSQRFPSDPDAIYMGLVWPSGIALMTVIIGSIFLKESRGRSIWREVVANNVTPTIENN